jgi:hypothetical protein
MKSKKLLIVVGSLIVVFLGLAVFHRPILRGAGQFLAPCSNEKGEVLILEGTQIVLNGSINAGVRLMSEGKAGGLVVVLQQFAKEEQVFALDGKYIQFLGSELEYLGLGKEKVQFISAPIDGHPITLQEARYVVARLSKAGVRSAVLLSEGFHTRRSFGVYNQEGNRVGIRIIPCSYFSKYENDFWWYDVEGIWDFVEESAKLAYYLLHGYLSLKSLWLS